MKKNNIWILPFESKLSLFKPKKIKELLVSPEFVPLSENTTLQLCSGDVVIMYPTLRNLAYALFHRRYKLVLVNGEPFRNSWNILMILLFLQFRFVEIFTHLKWYNRFLFNATFIPVGGCWINIGSKVPLKKKKLCSIIASSKNTMPGHKLRHAAINLIKKKNYSVDVMGSGYLFLEDKASGLSEYYYSIVIENCIEKDYFTEKLIDCFVTDVIPIYWGCPNIENYFDTDGMITFYDLSELDDIIRNLDESHYKIRSESMLRNKKAAEKLRSQIDRAIQIIETRDGKS